MPFYDILHQHFSPEELNTIDQSLEALAKVLKNKQRNLSPEERRRYGSIKEANKLFVNKVYDFYRAQPALCSPDVDWTEFIADYEDRHALEARITSIRSLLEMMENNKIMHDYDNYQNALMDYSYTQYKKDTDAVGYMTKYKELKQFFPRSGTATRVIRNKEKDLALNSETNPELNHVE